MNNQNQSPSPSTPSVDTSKSEPRRILWLIIAILLLAALGLGWWVWRNQVAAPPPADLAPLVEDTNIEPPVVEEPLSSPVVNETTPVSDDISNWQTYRNEEYRFEFKYPSSFVINNDKTWAQFVDGPAYSLGLSDQSAIEQPHISFSFRIRTDGHDTPYEILYNILVSDSGSINVISEDREFYKQSMGGPGFFDDHRSIKATTVFRGVPYEWTFYYKKGGFDYESIFRLILSTFRFIQK